MFGRCTMRPGTRQADLGEALVVIGDVEQKARFLAFDLPQGDAYHVRAYPAATAEAWASDHVHAFAFFGRVLLSVLYDREEDQESIQWIDFPTHRCLVARVLPPSRQISQSPAGPWAGPASKRRSSADYFRFS